MQKATPPYLKEMKPNHNRRARWHNYYGPASYMITMTKQRNCPDFGTLKYGDPKDAWISLSAIGEIIKCQIEETPAHNPQLKIADYVIMPDHVHILIEVTETTDRPLGDIIRALKSASSSRIRKMTGRPYLSAFDDGFNDRIIKSQKHLKTIQNYIKDNPRRLAVRRALPDYFRRVNALKIGDKSYQAYGNFQLLDCPFKEQVVVHRPDTPEERDRHRGEWLFTAANHGVLVSPFISPDEKAIRDEAEEAGGRFILITNEAMGERYKPAAHDFELCEAGRLLIITSGTGGEVSRTDCLTMNALAAQIVGE